MSKKISQNQARIYKRRLAALEEETRNDRQWHRGAHIRSVSIGSESRAVLQAVKDVGCVLAVRLNGEHLEIYGVR
jgi:hypothetical protein